MVAGNQLECVPVQFDCQTEILNRRVPSIVCILSLELKFRTPPGE